MDQSSEHFRPQNIESGQSLRPWYSAHSVEYRPTQDVSLQFRICQVVFRDIMEDDDRRRQS